MVLMILVGCLILPCLALLVIRSVSGLIEAIVKGEKKKKKKTVTQVMMLWKYKPLAQDDVL